MGVSTAGGRRLLTDSCPRPQRCKMTGHCLRLWPLLPPALCSPTKGGSAGPLAYGPLAAAPAEGAAEVVAAAEGEVVLDLNRLAAEVAAGADWEAGAQAGEEGAREEAGPEEGAASRSGGSGSEERGSAGSSTSSTTSTSSSSSSSTGGGGRRGSSYCDVGCVKVRAGALTRSRACRPHAHEAAS